MAIINLGSCCIDHVYHVPEFVRPGETLPCTNYEVHPGGKGLNQSIAIARAGCQVEHVGKIGEDGLWLRDVMNKSGVSTGRLLVADAPTGHANIQVNASGENAIVLFGGTNRMLTDDEVTDLLASSSAGDFLMLQNEISSLDTAMHLAGERGLRVMFNAAPMADNVKDLPLEVVEFLLINEVEGEALSGESEPEQMLQMLATRHPSTNVVLTLGEQGVRFSGPLGEFQADSPTVNVVDTTGAGDTFTGYFAAAVSRGTEIEAALILACKAAAMSVTRPGAASSIPEAAELQQVE